jgi:hypothetical protein
MLVILSGCDAKKIAYLNDRQEFSKLVGIRYELLVNCYVFKDTSNQNSNLIIASPEMNLASFPKTISKELVGKTVDYCKFLGIIPKGSVFELKKVRQETTIENTSIVFEINFPEIEQFKDTNIDGMFLAAKWPLTGFNLNFAREIQFSAKEKRFGH